MKITQCSYYYFFFSLFPPPPKKKRNKNMKKVDINHPEFTFSLEFYCNWNHIVLYLILSILYNLL